VSEAAVPRATSNDRDTKHRNAHHSAGDAVSALRYLWMRTASNRLRTQLKRVRNPRYAVAMVIGAIYMYWALFYRSTQLSQQDGPFGPLLSSEFIVPVGAALLLFMTARWWLFGTDRSALAFTPAEVQFLFPAPISRRGLVHAKLLRGQFVILINTLIWTVLLRGGATSLGGWRRGLAMWLVFSTLALHKLGAAIVRANAVEHARAGQRRSVIPVLVFMLMLGGVAFGVVAGWADITRANMQGVKAAAHAVVVALRQPAPMVALWPVRSLLAPVFAPSAAAWWHALPFSALVFALHYLWVVRLDASFEEAALEATQLRAERIQSIRSAQGLKKRSSKGKIARVPTLPLTGRPEVALAWKNVAAAMRSSAWRLQMYVFLGGLMFFAVVAHVTSEKASEIFLAMCAIWGAFLLVLGPLSTRFDLRLDLPRLAILKTYPLSGARLVAAEIGGVTLLHSVSIWVIMVVPITFFVVDPGLFDDTAQFPFILLSIAIAIPAINLLMFTLHNGAALMFPGWVRLGAEARGFETMGQNLLTMGATLIIAAVALVFPLGLGALIVWLGGDALGTWSLLVGTFAASALLCAEVWPVIYWLGNLFERTDVNDVAMAS
jgi:ABC-2 type transport system permease protein